MVGFGVKSRPSEDSCRVAVPEWSHDYTSLGEKSSRETIRAQAMLQIPPHS